MLKFYFQFPHLSSLTFSLQPSAEKSQFTCPTRSRPAVQPGVAGCSRSTRAQPCRFAPFLPRGRSTRTTKGLIRESCSSPFKRCTMHMYWHRLVAVCVYSFCFFFAATPQAQAVSKDDDEAALLNAALTGQEPPAAAEPNTCKPSKSK